MARKSRSKDIEFSKKYLPSGKISGLLRFKLDEALSHYSRIINTLEQLSHDHLLSFPFRLEDTLVKEAYIVGGLLRGMNESDIDLFLKTYNTSFQADSMIKLMHFNAYCKNLDGTNKPKTEWVDLYSNRGEVNRDHFQDKPYYRITNQIRPLLEKYKLLRNGKKKN